MAILSDTAWQHMVKRLERRRWLVWTPLALAFLTAYFHRIAPGVVTDHLMRDFNITRAADMGILASIYFYTYAALQIPAGILADYFGPRRTVCLAMVTSACGAILFGCSNSLFGLYVGRFLSSMGSGLIFVSIVKIQAEWFRIREFGTMSGLITLIGNAGALLATMPLAVAVDSLGWRSAFYIIAAYSVAMAAACWLAVQDRPGEVGLPAITVIEEREGAVRQQQPSAISITAGIRLALVNRYTWPPFFASVAVYGVYMAFVGIWGVPYLVQVFGLSRLEAANYMTVMIVGNMIGGPLCGYLSDRLGSRRWPFVCATALFLVAWLILTFWQGGKPPQWALFPLCLAIGIGVSGNTITVACVKEVNRPNITGIAAGIANSGAFIGGALMQPAFGWILDQYWQGAIDQGIKLYPLTAYQSAFGFCAAALAVGLAFTLAIRESGCRNISEPVGTDG